MTCVLHCNHCAQAREKAQGDRQIMYRTDGSPQLLSRESMLVQEAEAEISKDKTLSK